MDKRFFGIKLSTYISIVVCFAVAFFVWFIARYIEVSTLETTIIDFVSDRKYL